MNDNEQILAELRKISAWAHMQRKTTKWSLIVVAILMPALGIFSVLMEQKMESHFEDAKPKPTWYNVDQNICQGDFEKAIQIGEELLKTTPQYPEAQRRLAGAYLAAGNVEQARNHYAEAFRLFPSEENEKLLLAIEKRIKVITPQPTDAAADRRGQ